MLYFLQRMPGGCRWLGRVAEATTKPERDLPHCPHSHPICRSRENPDIRSTRCTPPRRQAASISAASQLRSRRHLAMIRPSRDARRQRVLLAIRAVVESLGLTREQRWDIYQLCAEPAGRTLEESRRFPSAKHLTTEAFLQKCSTHAEIFLDEVEEHHGFASAGDGALHDELVIAMYDRS